MNNMKIKNITLTLEKAKEWYNSGSADLKEIALQAFTKEELEEFDFTKIKTFEDAIAELGLDYNKTLFIIRNLKQVSKTSAAMFKLNIIRKALNKGKTMSFTNGTIWYPYTPCIITSSTFYNNEVMNGSISVIAKLAIENKEYYLLGDCANSSGFAGLGSFHSRFSVAASCADVGFLGCACEEIAKHMSKYFARTIFEAKYGDTIEYNWV